MMQGKPVIVVLTGAGISAESGLRTFRDSGGLWEGYNVEEVATPRAWRSNQPMVQDFYNQRRKDVAAAKPNQAHLLLATLEKDFTVKIVTQNIDDLHERAGSTKVLHLHGEIFKMRSEKQVHDDRFTQEIREDIPPGMLAEDGGLMRPHIVWFEEMVPTIMEAQILMQTADIFILIGTSLAVYPAAGLVDFVPRDAPKYIIDKVIPEVSRFQNIFPIAKPATQGMKQLCALLLKEK